MCRIVSGSIAFGFEMKMKNISDGLVIPYSKNYNFFMHCEKANKTFTFPLDSSDEKLTWFK